MSDSVRGLGQLLRYLCCFSTEPHVERHAGEGQCQTSRKANRHASVILTADKLEEQAKESLSTKLSLRQSLTATLFGWTPNPNSSASMETLHFDPKAVFCEAIVLAMVGLPARGKSYISGAVVRHLRLLGVRVRNFNAGELRRESGKAGIQADFFSASNKGAKDERERLAMMCLDNLLSWLRAAPASTSSIGILDATNTTAARRRKVLERCLSVVDTLDTNLRVIFLESICDDQGLLQSNYKMKLFNDDYKGTENPEAALGDFQARVEAYEQQYEPLQEAELELYENSRNLEGATVRMPVSSIRIFNGGRKIECCRTNSSLVADPLISLLHAMHLTKRRILLVPETDLHGKAVNATTMISFLQIEEGKDSQHIDVICGKAQSSLSLGNELKKVSPLNDEQVPRAVLHLRQLRTRDLGKGDDHSEQLAGESYADLVRRMRTEVILLLERLRRSVLVICPGEDVRRVLFAHFCGCDTTSLADLEVPRGRVVELTRDHKGFQSQVIDFPPSVNAEEPTIFRTGSRVRQIS